MGAYTTNAQVWYPGTTDTAELNTLLATVASSIEDGLGARMLSQEKLVSAVLAIPNNSSFPALAANTDVTPNFQVTTFGYNTGDMTLSAGTLTIATPGVYFLSSTMTFNDNTSYYVHSIMISGAEKVRGFSFKPNGGAFQYSSQTSVVKLAAGDTISTRVQANAVAGAIRDISAAGNVMTCTLLKPL
jgi:hypothetical protein